MQTVRDRDVPCAQAVEPITANETTIESTIFITAIANSSQFGNNAFVAPLANIQDGVMYISIIKKPSLFQLPAFLFMLFTKQLQKNKKVKMLQATKVAIETREKMPLHIDGETKGTTNKIVAEIIPACLKVWH